jgi:hypothetical protein
MQPFNLEAALAGKPVVTRDGRPVTQITKFKDIVYPVAGVLQGTLFTFRTDGRYTDEGPSKCDLFMKSEPKTFYANVYSGGVVGIGNPARASADFNKGNDRIGVLVITIDGDKITEVKID